MKKSAIVKFVGKGSVGLFVDGIGEVMASAKNSPKLFAHCAKMKRGDAVQITVLEAPVVFLTCEPCED